MSRWDSDMGVIVRWPTEPCKDYPGWVMEDCGCCVGIQWGGEYPRECRRCGGDGLIFRHIASGVLAQYPGGPLAGRVRKERVAA